ncbi:MAG: YdeI/OmpD-associated family protein [Bacteroidia bacterium]|nr:YdeI/OmpD-associated family protein [Bacteroidia bacterium]
MNDQVTVCARNRAEWRQWLEANHASVKEVWLVFFKKHTGKRLLSYDDAVEEAICFGWIDSIVRKMDDEKYMQKFTPRKAGSAWSESNIKRVHMLISQGKMTDAGLTTVDPSILNNNYSVKQRITQLSPEIEKILSSNKEAWKNFSNLPPSHQKQFIMWIMEAKKEETKMKRLTEAIQMLIKNERLGLK